MTDRWEYRITYTGGRTHGEINVQLLINIWGSDGWELVSATDKAMWFKRMVFDDKPRVEIKAAEME